MVSVTRFFLCLLAMLTGMPVAQAGVQGQSAPVAQGVAEQHGLALPVSQNATAMTLAPHSHIIGATGLSPVSTGCSRINHLFHFAFYPSVHRSDRARE